MRKAAFFLALILVFMMPLHVRAASARSARTQPLISYNGTTANCTVDIYGTNISEHLEATIKFWYKNRCLQTWEVSGYGILHFEETVEVTKGNTYRLSVDLAINGDMQPTVSFSKKCE